MFAFVFASILVLDEMITYGLSAVFGRGGGAGVWMLLIACLFMCRLRFDVRALIFVVSAVTLLTLSIRIINVSALYLIALTSLTVVVVASRIRYVPVVGSRAFMRGLEIVLVGRVMSMLGFDLFEQISGMDVNRPCGFYSEPSHFAYYVAILYLLAVFSRPQDRKRAAVTAVAALLVTFSASALLPLGIVLYDARLNLRHRKQVAILGCIVFVGMLAYHRDYLVERLILTETAEANLTSQVLVYYYKLFALHLTSAPLTAFGPDQFQSAYQLYSNQLGLMHGDLNSTDGSFLAVKLLVEYGLPFFLLFIGVLYWRIRQAGSVAIGLLLAQFFFLRGFGLTSTVVVALILVAHAHLARRSKSLVNSSVQRDTPAASLTLQSGLLSSQTPTKPLE
jgi:hypothetical protein